MNMKLFLIWFVLAAVLVHSQGSSLSDPALEKCRFMCEMSTCEGDGRELWSSDQKLSCMNACRIRHSGVSENECLGHCDRQSQSGCFLGINDLMFNLCGPREVRGSQCSGQVTRGVCELGCLSYPEGLCRRHGVEVGSVTQTICENTEEVCEVYFKKGELNGVDVQTGDDYCEAIGLTCVGVFEDANNCRKRWEIPSCSMEVPKSSDHIVRCAVKHTYDFTAWDSICNIEESEDKSFQHYHTVKGALPASEQVCAQFCSDWDECTAYSFFRFAQGNACVAFKECHSLHYTKGPDAHSIVRLAESIITRSSRPFLTPESLKSYRFLAKNSYCYGDFGDEQDAFRFAAPTSEQECEEFCSQWDECTAFSFWSRKSGNFCIAYKECDELRPSESPTSEYVITRSKDWSDNLFLLKKDGANRRLLERIAAQDL